MAPPNVEALMEPLARTYADAWEFVLAEQERLANDPRRWRAQRRLRETQTRIANEMSRLEQPTRDYIQRNFPHVYATGGLAGAAAPVAWSAFQIEALDALAGGLERRLLEATRYVNRTTKQLIRKIFQDEELRGLVAGGTPRDASRRAQRLVRDNGIHAVRYANGARHGLGEYANMAVRTQTGIAYNRGALDNAKAHDIEYVEVFDGPGCGWESHDDPRDAMGLILPADEAYQVTLAHPNCRRAFSGRPDVRSAADAEAADRSVTMDQLADQRVVDAERIDRLERRRRRLASRRERVRV